MILSLFCLLIISAFLASSETSLFSLSQTTLKSYQTSPNPKQQRIAALMASPRNVLVTLLMCNVFVNLLIQNTVADLFIQDSWALKVGLPLGLTLVFGEVLPKSISLPNNTRYAPRVVAIVGFLTRILRPIREPLTRMTHWISRFLFVFLRKEQAVGSDELRLVLQQSEERGILLPQECDLIAGSLDLQESIVKARMRPRDEILYYDIQEPLSQLERLFVDSEITRVPVCDGSLENLLGILSARSYFFHRHEKDLRRILKKPYFVPETINAWTLLQNLRERGLSLAVVVDEYGSISGLATQEDLIEAVVGEIADRRDPKNLYTRASEDVIIASGKLELSAFEEIFGIPLESEEKPVTLGGWLIEQLGDIPAASTQYTTDRFLFYILAAEPNRIRRIYVRCIKPVRRK